MALATANAGALQSAERALGLDIEVAANHWLAAVAPTTGQAGHIAPRTRSVATAGSS